MRTSSDDTAVVTQLAFADCSGNPPLAQPAVPTRLPARGAGQRGGEGAGASLRRPRTVGTTGNIVATIPRPADGVTGSSLPLGGSAYA